MKRKSTAIMITVMAAVFLTGCGGTSAAPGNSGGAAAGNDTPELKLIIASNQTSKENPYSYGMDKFKEVVEEKSGGKIAVTVHKGTLGENESNLVGKLGTGEANIIVVSPGFMTSIGVPEIEIFSLEYLFDSFDHWEKCLDGDFGSKMKEIVVEKTDNNFRIMGYWSSSVRDVYGRQSVTKPEDLKGMRIRTQLSPVQQDFFAACGAIPTDVAWGDLYMALQQGDVDFAENDYTNFMLKEHHKTSNGNFVSETHHDYTTRLLLMQGSFYDGLTEEQKGWIDEACAIATAEERQVTYRMFEESKQQVMDDGAVVTENADIDVDAFKAIAIPIQDKFAADYDMTEELEMIRSVTD